MRGKVVKKEIQPDIVYDNVLVAKLINQVMRRGKKTVAAKIVYQAFELIKTKTKKQPLDIFIGALNNTAPVLEVRAKRVGGATYQVPVEVRGDRKIALAMRWIIAAAKSKKGKPMAEKLCEDLVLAYNNEGPAIKKRQDMHRMAEANRAFAHFSR